MIVGFFFQAEDGIRDWSVTGVQTCALPISEPRPPARAVRGRHGDHPRTARAGGRGSARAGAGRCKIGRASCGERGESWEVAVRNEKKMRPGKPAQCCRSAAHTYVAHSTTLG